MPITWKNINSDTNGAAPLMVDAREALQTPFTALENTLKQHQALQAENRQTVVDNNTQAFRDYLAGFQNPEALQQAIQTGAVNERLQGFGRQIDREAVRGLAQQQLTNLQEQTTANQTFVDNQQNRLEGQKLTEIIPGVIENHADEAEGRKALLSQLPESLSPTERLKAMEEYGKQWKATYGLTDAQAKDLEMYNAQVDADLALQQEGLDREWQKIQDKNPLEEVYSFTDPEKINRSNVSEWMREQAPDDNWLERMLWEDNDEAKGSTLPQFLDKQAQKFIDARIDPDATPAEKRQQRAFLQTRIDAVMMEAARRIGTSPEFTTNDRHFNKGAFETAMANVYDELLTYEDRSRIRDEHYQSYQSNRRTLQANASALKKAQLEARRRANALRKGQ